MAAILAFLGANKGAMLKGAAIAGAAILIILLVRDILSTYEDAGRLQQAVIDRDARIGERDAAIAGRDAAIARRDATLRRMVELEAELGAIEAERDRARADAADAREQASRLFREMQNADEITQDWARMPLPDGVRSLLRDQLAADPAAAGAAADRP